MRKIPQQFVELLKYINLVRIGFSSQLRIGGLVVFSTLGIASVLLVGLYVNAGKQARWVNVSNNILFRMESLANSCRKMESDVRGYAYTEYEGFISDIESNFATNQQYITELYELTRDNPERQQQMKKLDILLKQRIELLKTILRHKKEKRNEALIKSDFIRSKLLMDELVQEMSYIEKQERQLRSDRQTYYRISSSSALIIIIIVLLATGITLAILFILLRNEFRVRQAHEKRLYAQQLQLEEKIMHLNASNQALEQFAYVASHDLQEPLRKIMTFSDRLLEKGREQLDENTQQYLDRIVNAASRMRKLIEDLLSYSRISSQQKPFEVVDLNIVVNTVIDDAESIIHEKQALITADPLLQVKGEASQLAQLFQNLVSNALKFTRPGVQPQISISASVVEAKAPGDPSLSSAKSSYYRIRVADNGIGFEKKYSSRIFVIFQRLHGRNEFEGTGIGLSVCKRIAENHGGFMEAEGKPGEGAVFYVYLPVSLIAG